MEQIEPPIIDELEYWRRRVAEMGRRSVFDTRHSDDDLAAVTAMQKQEIYPVLRGVLKPWYKMLIDFGCGYGRFASDLAEMIDGQVLAFDPLAELLQIAPPHDRVEYRLLELSRNLPIEDAMVDVAWCCLVLGTIHREDAFTRATEDLTRILKPGGLCFIVENISVSET